MKVLSVSCNNCGAPLEVPRSAKFVTCTFCESRLQIQQSGSAYYTDVIEAVNSMQKDVATIKLQNELERVDREWTMQREKYMTTNKHGARTLPTMIGAGIMIVVACVGGFAFMSIAPTDFRPMGLVFLLVGVSIGIFTAFRASKYEGERRAYESRRRKVLSDLRGQ